MQKEFRVYYGDTLATKEQLDAIEEIVVEQEIGFAWGARIRIPVCIGEDGSWHGEDDPAYAEFARVRVEARIGDGDFVALIDGTIQSQEPDYNATPGRSNVTLVVHDDSQLLNRESAFDSFSPGQSDGEIVTSIFESASLGESPDVEDTPTGSDTESVVNRGGTMMDLLLEIAARYGDFHVYVLPGASVGTSKGCFKKLPTQTDGLPAAILSGPNRNLAEFRIQRNSARASRYEGAHMSLSDLSVTSLSAGPYDAPPAGGTAATEGTDEELLVRTLPPGIGDQTDLEAAVTGIAAESGYTLRADGSVMPSIYPAVLSPYRMLSVRASNSRYSTDYVIAKVVHTLGISEYTQSFSVLGNAVSAEAGLGGSLPAAAAAPSLNFNVQAGIF